LPEDELASRLEEVPAQYVREEQQVEQYLKNDSQQAQQYLTEHDPFDRLAAAALFDLTSRDGIETLRQIVTKLRNADAKTGVASEETINNLGYQLIGKKKFAEAIAFLRTNVDDFPKSANAYDSYAEALFDSGDVTRAVENYRKALEIDPKYGNAEAAQKFVAEHGK
jgi:tetratricopeptide (TPR) repeat protein